MRGAFDLLPPIPMAVRRPGARMRARRTAVIPSNPLFLTDSSKPQMQNHLVKQHERAQQAGIYRKPP